MMMEKRRKVKFKSIKELYALTPKIMVVCSTDGCSMPAGGADCACWNKVSPSPERQCHHISLGVKLRNREESRTYNVGTLPDSTCMHIERVASVTGMKIDEVSLDGTFKEKAGSQCSVIGTNLSSPSSSSTHKRRHGTSSVTSDFLNTCSSQGLLSENSVSKATMRASSDSEDFDMLLSLDANRSVREPRAYSKSAVFRQNQMFSNQARMKKASCGGLVAGNNFCAIEEDVDNQFAHHHLPVSDFKKVLNNYTRWKVRCGKESLQQAEVFSHKSIESEMSSMTDFYGNTVSQKWPPEQSEEQVESTLTKTKTLGVGLAHDTNNRDEPAKANPNLDDKASAIKAVNGVNQKVLCERSSVDIHDHEDCLQSKDTLLYSDKPAQVVYDLNDLALAAAISHSDQKDCNGKSNALNYADGSDRLDDKIRVCAICGHEDQMETDAIYSMCNDGALQIFRMHIKSDKVFEGDWMCDKCKLMQKFNNERQDESAAKFSEEPSLNKLCQHSRNFGACNFGNILESSPSGSGVEENGKTAGFTSCLAVKRSFGTSKVMQANKKRAFETNLQLPQVFSLKRTAPCYNKLCDSNQENKKVHNATSCDRSSESTISSAQKNVPGSVYKSESFNSMHSKKEGKPYYVNDFQELKMLNNPNSPYSNGNDSMAIVLSLFEEFKHLEHTSEENLTQKICPSINPLTKPLVGSGVHQSRCDQKIESSAKTKDGDDKLGNASEETNYVAKEGPKVAFVIKENNAKFRREKNYDTSREGYLNATSVFGGRPYLRSFTYLLPAIPSHDFVWKGGFEIWKNGIFPKPCDGIQAHLSTSACSKVIDVVTKLPQKILVEEVPRLSIWPTQVPVDYTTEENICLYFFAEGFESYERNYKILLECLVNNDLALKAKMDGFELLIFTSNCLPDNLPCWNTSLFLWGMLRETQATCSEQPQLSGLWVPVHCTTTGKEAPEQSQDMYKTNLEDPEEWFTNGMKVQVKPDCKRVKKCYNKTPECPGFGYSNAKEALQHNETLETCSSYIEKQVLTSDCKYQSTYAIPNLELSLRSVNKSPILGDVSFSHSVRNKNENKAYGFTNANTIEHHEISVCVSSGEKQIHMARNENQSRYVIPNLELSLGPANTSTTLGDVLSSCNCKEKQIHTPCFSDLSSFVVPNLELSLGPKKYVLLSPGVVEYKDKEANCRSMNFKSNNTLSPALTLTIAPPLAKSDNDG